MSIWTACPLPGHATIGDNHGKQFFVASLPVRGEVRVRTMDSPRCQQTGLHADLTGGKIMQGVVADHQAGGGRDLQPVQELFEEARVGLAEMCRFIGGHMVKRTTVQGPPGNTGIDHRPREYRVGCQHDLPPPLQGSFDQTRRKGMAGNQGPQGFKILTTEAFQAGGISVRRHGQFRLQYLEQDAFERFVCIGISKHRSNRMVQSPGRPCGIDLVAHLLRQAQQVARHEPVHVNVDQGSIKVKKNRLDAVEIQLLGPALARK